MLEQAERLKGLDPDKLEALQSLNASQIEDAISSAQETEEKLNQIDKEVKDAISETKKKLDSDITSLENRSNQLSGQMAILSGRSAGVSQAELAAVRSAIPTDIVTSSDLSGYATTNSLESVKDSIPSNIATIEDIQDTIESIPSGSVLSDRITNLETSVALKTDIPDTTALATKAELNTVVSNLNAIPDASNIALKSEIPDTSNLANKSEIPDVTVLATKAELSAIESDLETIPDVSNIALKSEIPNIANLATKAQVDSINSELQLIPDVSSIALKSELPDITNLASKSEIPDISGLATRTELDAVDSKLEGLPEDLSKLALDSEIPNISNLATQASVLALDNRLRLEESEQNPDLSSYALSTSIPDISGLATVSALNVIDTRLQAEEARVVPDISTLATVAQLNSLDTRLQAEEAKEAYDDTVIQTQLDTVSTKVDNTRVIADNNTSSFVTLFQQSNSQASSISSLSSRTTALENIQEPVYITKTATFTNAFTLPAGEWVDGASFKFTTPNSTLVANAEYSASAGLPAGIPDLPDGAKIRIFNASSTPLTIDFMQGATIGSGANIVFTYDKFRQANGIYYYLP